VGETVLVAVFAPLLQIKTVPPDAVMVVELPTHTDGLTGAIVAVMALDTVTVLEAVAVQLPASVTVTV
jgi:hypothetical protein